MKKSNETIPVKYIGFYPVFTDRLYKTGLIFQQGQTLNVYSEPALKLLRHADMFELGEVENAKSVKNDTEVAKVTEEEQHLEEENGLLDEVAKMDKDALKKFAHEHYGQKLDGRKSLEDMRQDVNHMIAQFGAV